MSTTSMSSTLNIHFTERIRKTFRDDLTLFWVVLHLIFFIGFWVSVSYTDIYKTQFSPQKNPGIGGYLHFIVDYLGMILVSYVGFWVIAISFSPFYNMLKKKWYMKFLGGIICPIISVLLGALFSKNTPIQWCCLSMVGAIYSSFLIFGVTEDFGASDALVAISLSIIVNIKSDHWFIKCCAISVFGALKHILFLLPNFKKNEVGPIVGEQSVIEHSASIVDQRVTEQSAILGPIADQMAGVRARVGDKRATDAVVLMHAANAVQACCEAIKEMIMAIRDLNGTGNQEDGNGTQGIV